MVARSSVSDGVPVRQAGRAACVGCGLRTCGIVFSGYLRGVHVPGLACLKPVRLVSRCGHTRHVPCGTSRASECLPCSAVYRRRLIRVIDSGLQRHASRYLYLLTTTAPSTRAHRRWVVPGLYRVGMHRPECGCETPSVAGWNPTAGECWNRLRTAIRRLDPQLEFERVAEVQERGAIHHHTILASTVELDEYELQHLALAAGYGCQTSLDRITVNRGIEHYLSKTLGGYLTKASDARKDVPWFADVADQETGEVRKMHTDATYRTHSESREWGLTVKAIKAAIREHLEREADRVDSPQTASRTTGSEALQDQADHEVPDQPPE